MEEFKCYILGEQELREATVDKAHYLAQIGDCDEAIKLFKTSKTL